MVGVSIDPGRVAIPVTLRGRYTVDRELFHRQYPGERVAAMPNIWPHDRLYAEARRAVDLFIEAMRKQGFDLATSIDDLKIFGPYQSRRFSANTSRMETVGFAQGEDFLPESADFVLEGLFLQRRHRPPVQKDGTPW